MWGMPSFMHRANPFSHARLEAKRQDSPTSNEGATFACNINGYTTLVSELTNLSLAAITIWKSTIEGMLDLAKLEWFAMALQLLFEFLKGFNTW